MSCGPLWVPAVYNLSRYSPHETREGTKANDAYYPYVSDYMLANIRDRWLSVCGT